jgi:hypothetical protein
VLKVQAFAQDRYKVQWITGVESIAGLTSLFSSIYLIKVFGARRMFLLGTACLAGGALGESLARTPLELGVAGTVRSCAGFFTIPGLTTLQRLPPGRNRFAYCTYLTMVHGGQVVVEPIGALTAFHPSWRPLFAGFGALRVALFLVALLLFPDDRPERGPEHELDFQGMILFVAVLGLILFLLYRGNYLGWRIDTPIRAAAGALAALALFVWRELVAAKPFIHLGGFAFQTVSLAMLSSAFWCAALYGVAVQLPNCLLLLGYEQFKTGWVILPMGLLVLAAMFLGGFIRHRGSLVWLYRVGLARMTLAGSICSTASSPPASPPSPELDLGQERSEGDLLIAPRTLDGRQRRLEARVVLQGDADGIRQWQRGGAGVGGRSGSQRLAAGGRRHAIER